MHIREMYAREDIDQILRSTVGKAWSEMQGSSIQMVDYKTPRATRWRHHRLFSCYFGERPNKQVRTFLRDGFRGTPVKWRVLPQWALGTQLSTTIGLRLTSVPAFGMLSTPGPLPDTSSLLILPGNQRIRIFDFHKKIVRVVLKNGFDSRTMATEINVRRTNPHERFMLPITSHADDASWFEERIFSGYPLPRCPPWFQRDSLAHRAIELLDAWSQSRAHSVKPSTYVEVLRKQSLQLTDTVIDKFGNNHLGSIQSSVKKLCEQAAKLPELKLAPSHGDFQAGNILISYDQNDLKIIDWEHSKERSVFYDRLVFGLATRSAADLPKRWNQFLRATCHSRVLKPLPQSRDWRCSAAALVALEDLTWYLEESLSGPYFAPSQGLSLLIAALETGVLFR